VRHEKGAPPGWRCRTISEEPLEAYVLFNLAVSFSDRHGAHMHKANQAALLRSHVCLMRHTYLRTTGKRIARASCSI